MDLWVVMITAALDCWACVAEAAGLGGPAGLVAGAADASVSCCKVLLLLFFSGGSLEPEAIALALDLAALVCSELVSFS